MTGLQVFTCGLPKDHECNRDGEFCYGLKDGTITFSEKRAKDEGCEWGSVTCTICGRTAMENDMWRDWEDTDETVNKSN